MFFFYFMFFTVMQDAQNDILFTCPKLTLETPEEGVNFEQISHIVLVLLLLTLNK